MSSNKMREIKVEKVTLNIGTGKPGDELEKAMKLLNNISNMKPVKTRSKRRIPTWGVRPGLEIGCKVTLRKQKAINVLKQLLSAVNNRLDSKKFDDNGNFSFGVKEYLDIPNIKYDPEVGIIGLEAAVTLQRPGFRIKNRRLKKRRIHRKHLITKQEAIAFIKKEFNMEIIE